MKKIFIATALAAGVFSSGAALSQTAFQGNEDVDTTECVLLSEEVTLGVSANVHGAYLCNETSNLVQVAACHEGGSRSRGAACTDTDINTAGDQLPPGCDAVGGFSTIPNYIGFMASSEGGVLQEHGLGGRCSGATLTGLDSWSPE